MENPDARAALEFQEHLLGDLWGLLSDTGGGSSLNSETFDKLIENGLLTTENGNNAINLDFFLDHFEELFDIFKENFSAEDRYQGDLPKDFKWNWELLFEFFNIRYV